MLESESFPLQKKIGPGRNDVLSSRFTVGIGVRLTCSQVGWQVDAVALGEGSGDAQEASGHGSLDGFARVFAPGGILQ